MHKILLIHHAKNFESNECYTSDDFSLANRKLFGAQELDTWAGYRMLKDLGYVYRLQISHNLRQVQLLRDKELILNQSYDVSIFSSSGYLASYLKEIIRYGDTSIARNAIPSLVSLVRRIIDTYGISMVWSETQFYDAIIPNDIPCITRSVNYEPFHVLREDPSVFRFIRKFAKLHSERKVSRTRSLVAISPRDSSLYSQITNRNIGVLPLRQLPFLMDAAKDYNITNDGLENLSPYIYFAGSNFDVKHNLDNLKILIEKVSPALIKAHPLLKILVFGHRFPTNIEIPKNIVPMRFKDNFHSLAKASIAAIVPSPGGSGMQSKIFEPMCLGVPLIANSEAISGYPFRENVHFYPGGNSADIISSLESIYSDPSGAYLTAIKARDLCKSLFEFRRYFATIEEVLNSAHVR
jgi:hypothetical protein